MNLKNRIKQIVIYGVSIIALTSVAGISIAQADRGDYSASTTNNPDSHTGSNNGSNPTPTTTQSKK